MRRIWLWMPAIVVLGLAVFLVPALLKPAPPVDPMVGQIAPAPVLQMLERDSARAAEGGARLVNFWASWCTPCIAEHPQLMTLAEEGFQIDGYVYRDSPEKAGAVLSRAGDPFANIWLDPKGDAMMAYGVNGVPESFVIDKDGKIVLRYAGYIDLVTLQEKIRPALVRASR